MLATCLGESWSHHLYLRLTMPSFAKINKKCIIWTRDTWFGFIKILSCKDLWTYFYMSHNMYTGTGFLKRGKEIKTKLIKNSFRTLHVFIKLMSTLQFGGPL